MTSTFSGNVAHMHYVALEVIPKNSNRVEQVECGAFMGVIDKKDLDGDLVTFIVLLTSSTTIRMYNAAEYDIMTYMSATDAATYMTIFSDKQEDQAAAKTYLKEVVKTMDKENRLLGNDPNKELIDVDTYTELPKSTLTSNNLTDPTFKAHAGNDTTPTVKTTNTTATTTTTTTTTVQKEPEVKSFKRKGKLPSAEKLLAMRQLVVAMGTKDAQVEVRSLPVLKCDEKAS